MSAPTDLEDVATQARLAAATATRARLREVIADWSDGDLPALEQLLAFGPPSLISSRAPAPGTWETADAPGERAWRPANEPKLGAVWAMWRALRACP